MTHLLHLAALDTPDDAAPDAAWPATVHSALRTLQDLVESGDTPRVWLVTRGAQPVTPGPLAVAQAPLVGLGRVALNEHPEIPITLLDLDPAEDPLATLLRELATPAPDASAPREHEIAWRGGARFVSRLVRAPFTEVTDTFRVDPTGLRALRRRAPGPGEVEVRVAAADLDGVGFAGTVLAVGGGAAFAVGDRVLGYGDGTPATHVVVAADRVAALPAGLDPEAAAGLLLPALALTAAGEVRPGERVLLRDPTTALGLAARQALCGEIVAVADTPAAADLLYALGVARIVDGRVPTFADAVLALGGADLAFATSGPSLPETARALRPFGRLVHVGAGPLPEGLAAVVAERQLTVVPLDPLRVVREHPTLPTAALAWLVAALASGAVAPVPYRACPASDVAHSRARRALGVGATVVDLAHPRAHAACVFEPAPAQRADATWLVTGGLGGVGLLTAEWLAGRGVRHLVLAGRSGAATGEARAAVARLREGGVTVRVEALDVADGPAVTALIADLARTMPPLRGVVHGAMVLDDGFLPQLDAARMDRVLRPKALGAWNLHVATRHLPLDTFVLYSSIASVGLRGQANYVAANVFLDALAAHRRALGLPGLSLNWGVVGQVGYVSRNAHLHGYFDQQGMRPLSPAEVGEALGTWMGRELAQAFVFPVDWERLADFAPEMVRSPRFAHHLRASGATRAAARDGDRLRRARAATDPEERARLYAQLVADEIAGVLGLEARSVDADAPLPALGLDSLMAIELSGRLRSSLQLQVPIARLLQGSTVNQLARMAP